MDIFRKVKQIDAYFIYASDKDVLLINKDLEEMVSVYKNYTLYIFCKGF